MAIREMTLGVAWLVGLAALLELCNRLFGHYVIGAAIAGMLIVDVASGRAGVTWDDVPGARSWLVQARRLGVGLGVALVVVAGTVGLARMLGWATVTRGRPSSSIGLDVVTAVALSVRDELLYRGIPLAAAARAGVAMLPARAFAALVGVAAIALVPGVTAGALALALGSGWLFATLWQEDQGAWVAVGAHAGLVFLTGTVLYGGLADVEWAHGHLSLGPKAGGAPAFAAAGVAVAVSLGVRRVLRRTA